MDTKKLDFKNIFIDLNNNNDVKQVQDNKIENIYKLLSKTLGLIDNNNKLYIEGLFNNELFDAKEIKEIIKTYLMSVPIVDHKSILQSLENNSNLLSKLHDSDTGIYESIKNIINYFKENKSQEFLDMQDKFKLMVKQLEILQIKNIIGRCMEIKDPKLSPLVGKLVQTFDDKIKTLTNIIDVKQDVKQDVIDNYSDDEIESISDKEVKKDEKQLESTIDSKHTNIKDLICKYPNNKLEICKEQSKRNITNIKKQAKLVAKIIDTECKKEGDKPEWKNVCGKNLYPRTAKLLANKYGHRGNPYETSHPVGQQLSPKTPVKPVKPVIPWKGGGMKDYYKLYLKYKNKYLELKKNENMKE
jgi:hypothetical protein